MSNSNNRWLFAWIAVPIIVIDQLSKWWIERTIPLGVQTTPLPALAPYFRFSHVANTGAAFGLFQNGAVIFSLLAIVVSVALIYYNFRLTHAGRLVRVALGMVLGGALGNLIDRLRIGHVTDFIDIDLSSIVPIGLADWYVFNVADLMVTSAIVLLLYISLRYPEQLEPPQAVEPAAELPPPPVAVVVQPVTAVQLPPAQQVDERWRKQLLSGGLLLAALVWFVWRVATDEADE